MKALATTALKVFGVMQFYWMTGVIPQLSYTAMMAFRPGQEKWVLGNLVILATTTVIVALCSWVFTFRTAWIVERLQIPEEGRAGVIIGPAILLRTGLVLVGTSAVISALSTVAQTSCEVMVEPVMPNLQWSGWGNMLGAIVRIVLGSILLRRSNEITARIFPAGERIDES